MLTVVPDPAVRDSSAPSSLIDEIVREGARRMLAEALQAEVDAYIAQFAGERDENGRCLVVRNGYHQSREVLTSAGAVQVTAPRVNDKRTEPGTGQRIRISSAILPPWARKTPKITEVLPLLYLHGLSSGDFVPVLGQFLGSSAGLSAPVITKLTEQWKAEQRAFAARDLSGVDYVYVWADGIHVNIRLEEHKLCMLVMIGVRAPRSWPSATGHWGSGTGCARSSRKPRRAAAGSTRSQRPRGAAQVRPPGREEGPRRDLERRGQGPRPGRSEGVRGRLPGEVPQGCREDH
jgi:hypothetical protein